MSASRPSRGFTLVEMLVVLAIIGVLVALLIPSVMAAVNAARRAAIAAEISALDKAVEQYKQKKGDYPPNFRQYETFIRHVRKCYPKIDGAHLNRVIQTIWNDTNFSTSNPPTLADVPVLDEGECLVFWLFLVDNDARYPFKAADANYATTAQAALLAATSPEKIYTFEEPRLINNDGDQFPAYRAIYSRETCYLYIDSRAYDYFVTDFSDRQFAAYADGNNADGYYTRPYWSENRSTTSALALPLTLHYKPVNPTTFQIIGAGQDGLFGVDPATTGAKFFPGGGTTGSLTPAVGYTPDDRDNMTNFSGGRRLEDHLP
jgi:type II secretion system protein G